jgi:hypothetical protein
MLRVKDKWDIFLLVVSIVAIVLGIWLAVRSAR